MMSVLDTKFGLPGIICFGITLITHSNKRTNSAIQNETKLEMRKLYRRCNLIHFLFVYQHKQFQRLELRFKIHFYDSTMQHIQCYLTFTLQFPDVFLRNKYSPNASEYLKPKRSECI